MKWKKLVTLGCVVVMTVSSVTACGSNTTENQTVEATEQSEENQSDSVIVQVTAVEGDQITADVGTLTTASADASGNGAPGGEAPSGEAPGGDNSGNGAPGEAPSGDAPGGQMPGGSSFEASGESITFTLTDDTAITLEYLQGSGEGTADDIAKMIGDFVPVARAIIGGSSGRRQPGSVCHCAQLKCRRRIWRKR